MWHAIYGSYCFLKGSYFPGQVVVTKMGRERYWSEGLMGDVGEGGWDWHASKADRPDLGASKERQREEGPGDEVLAVLRWSRNLHP